MIFDLRSPRRRLVVRIVFGGLAAIFAISFIGFGVGSGNGVGGIFDQLFGSGNSGPSLDSAVQDQIDSAQAKVDADPKDERALAQLAEATYLAGNTQLNADGTLTSEAAPLWDRSRSAWESYLALKPKKPNDATAAQLLTLYQIEFQTAISSTSPDIPDIRRLLKGAVKTAAIVAVAQPSVNSYGNLASLAYLAGDTSQAEEASNNAIDKSPSSSEKSTQKFLDQAKKQGDAFQKSLAKFEKQSKTSPEEAFSNPLSQSLGGSSFGGGGAPPGGATPTP